MISYSELALLVANCDSFSDFQSQILKEAIKQIEEQHLMYEIHDVFDATDYSLYQELKNQLDQLTKREP